MKKSNFLLLLLLLASCGSRQAMRHQGQPADVQPDVPAVVQEPVATADAAAPEALDEAVCQRTVHNAVTRFPSGTWQADKQRALDSLCLSPILEATQLGLYVFDLTDSQPIYAVGAAQRMRPASCQKVVTAVTALHYLGGDYSLHTDFLTTGKVSGGTLQGDLIVRGGMDPLVTKAELLQAAATLRQQHGIERIGGHVVFDLSMREDAPLGWGWCWDDDYGPLSALLVDGKDCFEQNWTEALKKAGIKAPSPNPSPEEEGRNGRKAQKSQHNSGAATGEKVYSIVHGVDDLLVPMMKESDNIYAECLFYQTAAQDGKRLAGRKEAAAKTESLLSQLGLDADASKVADGSGLSLYNYTTVETLVGLLRYAWQNESIRQHLLPSLPVAGFDGTLKNRMKGTAADGNVRAKTGTVSGISSLAGYLTAANGHILAFAIINQGVRATASGRSFQDDVCLELCR